MFSPHTDVGGIAIVGKTIYLGEFGFDARAKPQVVTVSLKGGKAKPFLTGTPVPIIGLGASGGYLYVGAPGQRRPGLRLPRQAVVAAVRSGDRLRPAPLSSHAAAASSMCAACTSSSAIVCLIALATLLARVLPRLSCFPRRVKREPRVARELLRMLWIPWRALRPAPAPRPGRHACSGVFGPLGLLAILGTLSVGVILCFAGLRVGGAPHA